MEYSPEAEKELFCMQDTDRDTSFMAMALAEAQAAADRGEVPVGAVIVSAEGEIIARVGNRTEELSDPTAHAEILAIRAAGAKLASPRLVGAEMFVTLEPCAMCAGAISFARLKRVVYGASDPKGGAVDNGPRFFTLPTCHHRPQIQSGLMAEDSGALLRSFFAARRK